MKSSITSWLTLLLVSSPLFAGDTRPVYLDPGQPQAARIHDLVTRMTLEEKGSLMSNSTPGVPRLGIPKYDWWSEALHGVANSGVATVFPQAIGLAAMWDAPLHQEIAGVIGHEGRAKFNSYAGTKLEGTIFHGLTFWSPNINIFRDPRWGRGQETYGEDPFLTARLGVAFVRGLQGNNPDYLQAASCAKHYAVHSGPESLRHRFDVSPSEADLYETYLPAFEALVREGHVEIVMTAYNSLYGAPCSISPLLYGELTKWGFNGHVTSDCGSVGDLIHAYKRAADSAEAEALVLKAGMNVTCGGEGAGIVDAVKRGLISEAIVDERVSALLRTMFRLGFFDPKDRVPYNAVKPAENDTPAHGALALRAARESIVLLKNDGILPLKPESFRHLLVVGPNASSVPVLVGNYNGTPSKPVTVLDGLKAALDQKVTIDYAHGCDYAMLPDVEHPIANTWYHGEYFANPELKGPPVERTERPIRFDFAKSYLPFNRLPAGLPEHDVSARWTGTVATKLGGDYRIIVHVRGGARLTLDGETVIDSWIPPAGQENTDRQLGITRHLKENATLNIKLEFVQGQAPGMISLEWKTPRGDVDVAEAMERAKSADLIVYVGGISAELEGEEMQVPYEGFAGGDRTQIELPKLQQELLEKLHATGKPIVFVCMSGSAIAMPWADDHLNAIVQSFYPGQAGGAAVADVLLGNYNPAGRLPVTFYRATSDLPDFKEYAMAGRTYRYFDNKPLYAFGHGLSYTKFDYSNLQAKPGENGSLLVTVDVANSGARDGDEVVQLYATPPAASHPREHRALCGFGRVHLKAGEKQSVTLTVPATALRRWNAEKKDYSIPTGEWTVAAGASSADIRQTSAVKL
jgi:beta-glucosidase